MKIQKLAVCAAAFMLCGAVQAAQAQTWTGAYISGTIGGGMQPEGDNRIVLFDKNLDRIFNDTVTTVTGANAFSPGFCDGAAVNALPASGCTKDYSEADYGVRGGYDWQAGRFVLGGVGEFAWMEQPAASAPSARPRPSTRSRESSNGSEVSAEALARPGRLLVYGTGGLARASVEHSFTTSNVVNTFVPTGEKGVWGYQAGGGLEIRVGQRWALGAGSLMTSLDDKDKYTVRVQGPAPATNPFILTNAAGTDLRRSEQFDFHTARLTAAYRF